MRMREMNFSFLFGCITSLTVYYYLMEKDSDDFWELNFFMGQCWRVDISCKLRNFPKKNYSSITHLQGKLMNITADFFSDIPRRNRTLDLQIPHSDALRWSHRDSVVSKALYEVHI